MGSENKNDFKEIGRSFLNSPPSLPPSPISPSITTQKNEDEMSLSECDSLKPCVSFKCIEKKRKINYGQKPKISNVMCEHIQILGSSCEKCCKLITLNKYVISLHCAWHHSFFECYNCKGYIKDKSKIFKGFAYCPHCYQNLIGHHATNLKTVHFLNSD